MTFNECLQSKFEIVFPIFGYLNHAHELQYIAGMDYIKISAIGKVRKRLTFFSPKALIVLNRRFEQSSHPSGFDHEFNKIN
jgi:hypothetical protein